MALRQRTSYGPSVVIYTGIGSRETPADILSLMTQLAALLGKAGWTLRSGAAAGADSAFEAGSLAANATREIYLPFAGFRGHKSPLNTVSDQALRRAEATHPAWGQLNRTARLLHARNVYQVLGPSLSVPSDMVICWTPDGCESESTRSIRTGGTGTAIALADRASVPVFNLKNEASRVRLYDELLKCLDAPSNQAVQLDFLIKGCSMPQGSLF